MNKGRKLNKLQLVRQHRKNQYLYAVNRLIDGKTEPQEAENRWQKLKEVKP